MAPPEKGPAILLFDIENTPALAWVWGAYNQDIIAVERDWHLLSFAYAWYRPEGKAKVDFVGLNQDPDFTPDGTDDLFVAERLAAVLDAADIVIAHNAEKFDRRKVNARLLYHRIDPPSPYQVIDTLKVSKREFANYSDSLKELSRLHSLGAKVPHHGFDLWRSCMRGDAAAWRLMERYNRHDVRLLESAYRLLVPYMGLPGKPGHPNLGLYTDKPVCPKCGHDGLVKRGFHRTSVSVYQTFRCSECGGYSRARVREKRASEVVAV